MLYIIFTQRYENYIIDGEIRASSINYQLFSNKSFSPPSHMPQASYHQQSVIFPEITGLSLNELKFLNESVERQEEFIEELPLIKEQNKVLDDMITQIEELAGKLSKSNKTLNYYHYKGCRLYDQE